MSRDRSASRSTWPMRFARFVVVGGFATVLMYVLLVIGTELLGIAPVISSVLAYLLSALANYALNHRYTFRSTQAHRIALARFAVVSGCGLLLNALIMYVGTELYSWHYLIAQVLATVCVLFWNFLGSQLWTFRASAAR
ncbi:GtrA family protein [Fontimonas sp. SYSU GA230001]|uniref:GtrA family protein n=1 Tax=Fontimonas sp. SYSU GA230001 TaxID=3142450 RepID=UPI0032B46B9A